MLYFLNNIKYIPCSSRIEPVYCALENHYNVLLKNNKML